MMKKPVRVVIVFALVILTLYLVVTYPVKIKTFKSPNKKYTVVVTSKIINELSGLFSTTMPGDGGSNYKPVDVEILDSNGQSMGKIHVPIYDMVYEITWTGNGAEIKLIGEWDFKKGTAWYWSDDQNEQIWVNKP